MLTVEEMIALLNGVADGMSDTANDWESRLPDDIDSLDHPTRMMHSFYTGYIEGQREAANRLREFITLTKNK